MGAAYDAIVQASGGVSLLDGFRAGPPHIRWAAGEPHGHGWAAGRPHDTGFAAGEPHDHGFAAEPPHGTGFAASPPHD